MGFHNNYWSCSRFADWLRGTAKPGAQTSKGWRQWRQAAKESHPIRFWIVEDGLDYLQDFVTWPATKLNEIRYYINNRWVTRSHALTAHPSDIRPGTWSDVGNRFLPCLFNELVDFIEIEQAWHHCLWSDESKKKYAVPWWRKGWLRWRSWRCPQAGLDYLSWASELKTDDGLEYTMQAKSAQEMITLYHWWKDVYPYRPDPHDAGGWTAICTQRRENNPGGFLDLDWEDRTPADRVKTQKALTDSTKIEEQYAEEDEEMMIRLIRIRQSLWT